MDVVPALSGPLGQRITWTLLHFIWQGAVLAGLVEVVAYLFAVRSMAARYRLTLAALMLMAACPIVTFHYVQPEPSAANASQRTAVERPAPMDAPQLRMPRISGTRELSGSRLPPALPETPLVDLDSASLPQGLSALRCQPYLLVAWAVGAGLLGLRLVFGGGMAWHIRRGRQILDSVWADRASRLARRMGLHHVRVFVSTRVPQAVVTGLLRPMVLLPAAWLAEMPPDMLEGVLAHELAHLKRLDLWWILLQRLVETFLFYHPAVWWLSRRLDREREICCDEMAVAAIGDRLALTKALQWAVQLPAAGSGPVLGAAWKGSQKMIVERIRRLLGADCPRERFFWWPLGLAALVAPALMLSAILAKDPSPTAKATSDATPTLAEIAKANDAAWAAVRSVDLEMETAVSLIARGKTVREIRLPGLREMQLPGFRWSKDGVRERLHGRLGEFALVAHDLNDIENNVNLETNWIDQYYDGKKTYAWHSNDRYAYEIEGVIYARRGMTAFLDAILLRYIVLPTTDGVRFSTLAPQLIASGGVTIRGKQTSEDGDTIWVLEVDEPTSREAADVDKKNPSFTRIYVNADKSFLVSRVASHLSRTGAASWLPAAEGHDFTQVVKFTDCGHGVFFPSTTKCEVRMPNDRDPPLSDVWQKMTMSATRLSVNNPLPSDAFGFRFPEHTVVYETEPAGSTRKVILWGSDNKPAKEFATEKDFDDFQRQERAKEMQRQAEPRHDVNKPAGIPYNGPYIPPLQSSAPALGDMSLTLGSVGDEVVLTGDLLCRVDEMVARSHVPPEKRDEQRAALVKDVTDAIHDYAAHVAAGDPDPAKGISESHRLLLHNMVRQSLDMKMIYQDFRKEVPKEGLAEIQERVDRHFDDTQLKAQMKRENVATPAELESALRAKGISLDRERKNFTEQFIAQQWIVHKVKPEGGSENTDEFMKRQQEFLKKLRDKYPSWTVFDAAFEPAQVPRDHERSSGWLLQVNFVGNQFVSSARLKTLVDSPGPVTISALFGSNKFVDDSNKLVAYYRSLGFLRAAIKRLEFDEKQNSFKVTFVIDEGPRYTVRNIKFLGNHTLNDSQLDKLLKLRSGQYFDEGQQNLDLQKLRDEYGAAGYVFAKIEAENHFLDQPDALEIVYHVEKGDLYRVSRLKIDSYDKNPLESPRPLFAKRLGWNKCV